MKTLKQIKIYVFTCMLSIFKTHKNTSNVVTKKKRKYIVNALPCSKAIFQNSFPVGILLHEELPKPFIRFS